MCKVPSGQISVSPAEKKSSTVRPLSGVKKSCLHVIECCCFKFCLVKSVSVPVGQVSVIAQVPVTKVLAHEEPGHRGP